MIINLLNYTPKFINKKLQTKPELLKIIDNIGWLFFDKILRMGVGLLVGVWVARYLGPGNFGLLNYAIAFTGLFGAIGTLGLQGIVVRDIVISPNKSNTILGTAFVLRFVGGLISFFAIVVSISILKPEEILTKIIITILGFSSIIQSGEVIKWWFESQVQSKYVVWTENVTFLFIAAIKICLILFRASLLTFVLVTFFETLLATALLLFFYWKKTHNLSLWRYNLQIAKKLLTESWPLVLSGLAIAIYMKIDQVMLGQMLGDKAVGIYSAAVRVSEIWYFIPGIIVSSVFPSIIEAKKTNEIVYYQRLQRLYDIVIWIGIIVAILMSFLSNDIINILFGNQYSEAGNILRIHIWAGINVAIGTAWSNWIVIENKQKIVLYGHIIGAILNIFLNLFLIRLYGANGAAISTLISYWISALIIYGIYKPTKSYGLFIRSLNLIRIINGAKKYK